ncbi:MAG: tetratricopeptide repeat protein [Promethearchaeota archaeon]
MSKIHNSKQQRLLGIKNKITLAFILFLIIPIIIIVSVSLVNMNGLGNDVADISGGALENEQYRSMDEVTNTKGTYINDQFTKKAKDVDSFVQYAEDIFNEKINVNSIPSYYHTETPSNLDYEAPAEYGGRTLSFDASFYYFPNSSITNDDPSIQSASMNRSIAKSAHFDVFFKQMKTTSPEYGWIYMGFEEQGMFRCYPFTEWDVEGYWYQQAKEENQSIFTEPYIDANGLGLMISIAKPVHYSNGTLIGVIAVDLTIQALQESILNTKVLDSGYAFLISDSGSTVSHPSLDVSDPSKAESEINKPITDSDLEGANFAPILSQMNQNSLGNGTFTKNGEEWYITYQTIPSTNYKFGVVVPLEEIVEPASIIRDKILSLTRQQLVILLVVLVGAVIAIGFTSNYVSKRIVNPITNLTKMMNFISQGSISREIPMESKNANDEIAVLTSSFQNLITMLRLGNSDYYRGNLDLAAKNYSKALEIFELSGNKKGMAICANNLGNIYRIRGDVTDAEAAYKLAIQIANELNDPTVLAKRYNNLAQLYADSENADLARKYFEESIKICNAQNLQDDLPLVFRNFGLFKSQNNQVEDGQDLIRSALEIDLNNKDDHGIAYNQFYLGKIAHITNEAEAIDILEESLVGAKKVHDVRLQMNIYKEMELVHQNNRNRSQAHRMRVEYEKLRVSLIQKKFVVMVIDVSGSMVGNRMHAAVNGALEIYNTQINPQDEMAIILFHSISEVVLPPIQKGGNEEYILRAIRRIRVTQYQTALFDAIGDSFNLINQRISDEHKWVIALTDGMDNQSNNFNLNDRRYKGFWKFLNSDQRIGLGEYIEENLITMNLLLIGIGKDLIPIEPELKNLCARSVQGRYISVRDTHNAKIAIQNAFQEVSSLLAQINVEDFIENN